jgi:two-component system phosphate regulon response regulator PhoB
VPSVLIAHTSERAAVIFKNTIQSWGYDVDVVTERDAIPSKVNKERPDVLILNSTSDEPSGLMLSRSLRLNEFTANIPSILIAADFDEGDIAVTQEQTASDCLISPFTTDELKDKIDALLPKIFNKLEPQTYEYEGVVVNTVTYRVQRDDVTLHLTPKCFKILTLLIKQPTHVISREELMRKVWGEDNNVEKRTIDVHIKRLRASLNKDGAVNILRTVRGAGYSIDINPV